MQSEKAAFLLFNGFFFSIFIEKVKVLIWKKTLIGTWLLIHN